MTFTLNSKLEELTWPKTLFYRSQKFPSKEPFQHSQIVFTIFTLLGLKDAQFKLFHFLTWLL